MKKLFALMGVFVAASAFNPAAVSAAEGDTLPPEENPVVEELTDEELQEQFTADLNETLALIFSYIGGSAGIAAVAAFGFRFLKDRKVMKNIQSSITEVVTSNKGSVDVINNLALTVQNYSTKEAAMEKAFITMLSMSPLDPTLKQEIITGLQNDTVTVEDVINSGLMKVKEDIASNAITTESIKASTASLLEKLAQDNQEV